MKIRLGLLALTLIATSVSSHALAQGRKLTPQEQAQMQKEIAWQKQQNLKAAQDARTTYTERCAMTGGRLNCQGAQPVKQPQTNLPQTRGPVVQTSPKIGTAYGNMQGNVGTGYSVDSTFKPSQPRNPTTQHNGVKNISQ